MGASNRQKQGFALIVVLATLSILALLFAISSSRFLANLAGTEAELELARRQQENQAFAELALATFSSETSESFLREPLVFQQEDRELTLELQDVGGLVDLNTAAPDLLDALSTSLGIPDDAVQRFRQWRRTPYRLQGVSDFARVAGLSHETGLQLRQFATVHSGRFGIAPDLAPEALLELLQGSATIGSALGVDIPPVWQTPASGVNFRLDLWEGGRFMRSIGVVHLGGSVGGSRILELY